LVTRKPPLPKPPRAHELSNSGAGTAVYVEQRHWLARHELKEWYAPVLRRYARLLFVAPPKIARRLEDAVKTEHLLGRALVVEFERDPYQPAQPLLPPLKPTLDGNEPNDDQSQRDADKGESDPWADAAPTPEPTGAAADPTHTREPVVRVRPANHTAGLAAARARPPRSRRPRWR
jgi:hypothetical protein